MADILGWSGYRTIFEHDQLGDYGGACKLRVGITCQPCRDAGKDFMVMFFSEVLPDGMDDVLAKIMEHELERHGRVWRTIGE